MGYVEMSGQYTLMPLHQDLKTIKFNSIAAGRFLYKTVVQRLLNVIGLLYSSHEAQLFEVRKHFLQGNKISITSDLNRSALSPTTPDKIGVSLSFHNSANTFK